MSRYKLPDGTPVPRTTEVMTIDDMSDGLCMWSAGLAIDRYAQITTKKDADKAAYKTARRAFFGDRSTKARIGTCGHAIIEELNHALVEGREVRPVTHDEEGKPFSQHELQHGMIVGQNYVMWSESMGGVITPVLVETEDGGQAPLIEARMVSEAKLVGGTPDMVGVMPDGRIAGLDWKSGKRIGNTKQLLQSGSYDGLVAENFGVDLDVFMIVRLSPWDVGDFTHLEIERKELTAFRTAFGKVVESHHAVQSALALWKGGR